MAHTRAQAALGLSCVHYSRQGRACTNAGVLRLRSRTRSLRMTAGTGVPHASCILPLNRYFFAPPFVSTASRSRSSPTTAASSGFNSARCAPLSSFSALTCNAFSIDPSM